MLFSVIIPTYKRREALGVCLRQLAPEIQKMSSEVYEVIVSDDALDEGSQELLSRDYPWLLHNRGPKKGPAANRNSGAKSARGDWLIFLDDDCFPEPSFLSGYSEAINNHPRHLVFEGSTLAERPRSRLDEEAPINATGGYLWSCNFMIQRNLFFEMSGFCEIYPYACMEDVDFREQLKKRAIDFLFVPKASVIHPWRPLTPDDRYMEMRLVSHEIFFHRYPQLRPSFYMTCRTVLRGWILGLLMEIPRLKCRGLGRYLERQVTITKLQFLNWSKAHRMSRSL